MLCGTSVMVYCEIGYSQPAVYNCERNFAFDVAGMQATLFFAKSFNKIFDQQIPKTWNSLKVENGIGFHYLVRAINVYIKRI